jgi:hypothetical protein
MPMNYTENEPHRNRISKAYISHSPDRNLRSGDTVLIYRVGETAPKKYSSTITTVCIVESVVDNIRSFEEFAAICHNRTVIKTDALKTDWWDKNAGSRPFVINFLYAHSFPTPKPTLNDLNRLGVIPDIMNIPRGFISISTEQLDMILNLGFGKR